RSSDLERESAETAKGADMPAPPGGPYALGGILEDLDAGLVGERGEAVHIGRVPVEVDHDDRPGPGPDERGNRLRRDAVDLGVDVGEDRLGADATHRIGRCLERERGD